MRFVIGLIFGGGLILLAAQHPDRPWLREATSWLDRLAEAAGDALDLPARPANQAVTGGEDRAGPAGDGVAEAAAAARSAGVEPAQLPISRPPDPPAPDPAREDVQRLVAEIFERPAGSQADAEVAAEGPAATAAGTEGAQGAQRAEADGTPRVADAGPRVTAETGAGPAVPASAGTARAPVWVPFHSQMSADGFAERLSESLDHPFRVERQGPGRYQVVFVYADEAERLALLDQASAVTGLPL